MSTGKLFVAIFTVAASQHAASQTIPEDLLPDAFVDGLPKPSEADVSLEEFIFSADEGNLNTLDDIKYYGDSVDQQVISPRAARDKYRGVNSEWATRSEEGDTGGSRILDDGRAVPTCDVAVNALFAFACGGNRDCEIESAYSSKCSGRGLSEVRIQKCLSVEATYVQACYHSAESSCKPQLQMWGDYGRISTGTNGSVEDFIGSATIVKINPEANPTTQPFAVATSNHVVEEYPTVYYSSYKELANMSSESDSAVHVGDYLFLGSSDQLQGAKKPLEISSPIEFEQTYLLALNSLSLTRHQMVLDNPNISSDELQGRYYHCDSSATCTVALDNGDLLEHTCQSTKGSSGGALVQMQTKNNNETVPVVVGINEGALSSGVVENNIGASFSNYIKSNAKFISLDE